MKVNARLLPMLILLTASFTPSSHAQTAGELFKSKCVACHGEDGKGQTPAGKGLHARDLSSADVQKQGDTDLGYVISNGKNKMPAFTGFSPEQITSLVKYIRGMKK